MKSKMRIDFEGRADGGLEPVIMINMMDSEDPRDGLLKAFFEKLGGESNWLVAEINSFGISGESRIALRPVTPSELQETVDIIKNRIGEKIRFNGEDVYIKNWPVRWQSKDSDGNNIEVQAFSQEEINNLGFHEKQLWK